MPRRDFMKEVMLRSVISRLFLLFHNSDRLHFQLLTNQEQEQFATIQRPFVNDLETAINNLEPCGWKTILLPKLQTYKTNFHLEPIISVLLFVW